MKRSKSELKRSKGESRLAKHLDSKELIVHIPEFRIEGCRIKNLLRFDESVFVKTTKGLKLLCLIEFHGEQHYKEVAFWGLQNYEHSEHTKKEFCTLKSIPLLIIPYTEINRLEAIVDAFISNISFLHNIEIKNRSTVGAILGISKKHRNPYNASNEHKCAYKHYATKGEFRFWRETFSGDCFQQWRMGAREKIHNGAMEYRDISEVNGCQIRLNLNGLTGFSVWKDSTLICDDIWTLFKAESIASVHFPTSPSNNYG